MAIPKLAISTASDRSVLNPGRPIETHGYLKCGPYHNPTASEDDDALAIHRKQMISSSV
jgi:hypothetical protein